jgi:methionyl-tRNA formyltransferase
MPIRIVFMGSPDFAVPTLCALAAHYTICGVVSQPDRPSGRGLTLSPPPVKIAAQQLGLPVTQPEKLRSPEAFQQLQDWNPDLIVVAAFGQILRPNVLELPHFGCINVHASLLPRHRGAAPIQAAILAGDDRTGITIMKMDAGLDTGPMLSQRSIPIDPDDTGGSLFDKLSILGGELLLETLPGYLTGEVQPQLQPEEGVTYFGMIKKEDGLLDFNLPAVELERKIRAFSPWPGTTLLWKGTPLKIHRAHTNPGQAAVGKRLTVDMLPAVATLQGLIVFDELQPAGKKPMPGKAFLAGARDWETV